jgi:hypothetical protein
MSTIYEQVKNERGKVESILGRIPGYKGYKEKEMRRESDRILREALVRDFNAQLSRLSPIQNTVLENGGIAYMDKIGGVKTALQTLIDRIRNAPMGYAGFFDANRVKEDDLERLEAFDQQLAGEIVKVGGAFDELEKAATANDPDMLNTAISNASKVVRETSTLFDQRGRVITGV